MGSMLQIKIPTKKAYVLATLIKSDDPMFARWHEVQMVRDRFWGSPLDIAAHGVDTDGSK